MPLQHSKSDPSLSILADHELIHHNRSSSALTDEYRIERSPSRPISPVSEHFNSLNSSLGALSSNGSFSHPHSPYFSQQSSSSYFEGLVLIVFCCCCCLFIEGTGYKNIVTSRRKCSYNRYPIY